MLKDSIKVTIEQRDDNESPVVRRVRDASDAGEKRRGVTADADCGSNFSPEGDAPVRIEPQA